MPKRLHQAHRDESESSDDDAEDHHSFGPIAIEREANEGRDKSTFSALQGDRCRERCLAPAGEGAEYGFDECLESAPENGGRVELHDSAANDDPPSVEDLARGFGKRGDASGRSLFRTVAQDVSL